MPNSDQSSGFKRRTLLQAAALAPLSAMAAEEERSGTLTDVTGIRVGQFTDKRRPTGCTVLLFDKPSVAGVDVRGSAPGTRETDLLHPVNSVQEINALLLSGGSAFGLDAASGVMRYLRERGQGFAMGSIVVPIVPAAILFDLHVGDPKIWPDADAGYQACLAASNGPVQEGNVGAGAGATVGKLLGMKSAMKSGLGSASVRAGDTDVVIGAIAAVNAVGDVIDPKNGSILAGARAADGKSFANAMGHIMSGYLVKATHGTNTTLGVVATNARLNKTEMTKVAQMAQDALARTINPVHTAYDGDTVFAVSTGTSESKAEVTAIGAIAAEVLSLAITRAVRLATGIPGYPSYRDLKG